MRNRRKVLAGSNAAPTPTNDEYKVRVMVAVLEPIRWGNLINARAASLRTCSRID
jgi:hypothetical protein